MTDKKSEEETVPRCKACGKILIHCKCSEKELKK